MHIRLTPLAATLRPVIIGLSIASTSLPLLAAETGAAVTDHQQRDYAIAPGNLDQVLGIFGQQS
ncbi:hypothetical protein, partial [Pseudomonas protegens]